MAATWRNRRFTVVLAMLFVGCGWEVDNPALDLDPGSVLVVPVHNTTSGSERVLTRCLVGLVTGTQMLDQARSDETYVLDGLPVGPFVVGLQDPETGLEARVEGFQLLDGDDAVNLGRVVLEPPQSQVTGTVTRSDGESAAGGLVVVPFSRVGTRIKEGGQFTLRRIPRGAWQVAVVIPDVGAVVRRLSVAGAVSVGANPSGRLSGTVVLRGGGPLADALISLQAGGEVFTERSNDSGEYSFADVPTGVYRLLVSAENADPLAVPNVPVGVDLELPPLVLGPLAAGDYDGDGTPDAQDADRDNDGVDEDGGDPDVFPLDRHEWHDSDGDGVGDNWDNCPDEPNPAQTDTDQDGIGDACVGAR